MTQFTVSARDLKAALRILGKTIERRNKFPILGHILATPSARGVRLSGTDLDICATADVAAEGVADGFFPAIPFAQLAAAVKAFPNESRALFKVADESAVTVECGRTALTLQCLPRADFPRLELEKTHVVGMPAAALRRLFGAVAFAMSQEETRYYLNGAYLHPVKGRALIRAAATDGHRLASEDLEFSETFGDGATFPGTIVPAKTVRIIVDALKPAAKEMQSAIVTFYKGGRIGFAAPGVEIVSKSIDGTFPDYERVIPKDNPRLIAFDGRQLADMAKRLGAMSADRTRSIKLSLNGALVGEVNNPELGKASQTMALDRHDFGGGGPEMAIGFNAAYICDAMEAFDCGPVEMRLRDPASPVVMTSPDHYGRTVVLMPLRV